MTVWGWEVYRGVGGQHAALRRLQSPNKTVGRDEPGATRAALHVPHLVRGLAVLLGELDVQLAPHELAPVHL